MTKVVFGGGKETRISCIELSSGDQSSAALGEPATGAQIAFNFQIDTF